MLVMQGGGSQESVLADLAVTLGVADRILMPGWVDPGDLHTYASDADAGVVIYQPTSLNNRLAAPNKLWTYLMAGLPVVASDLPTLRSVVDGEHVGRLFDTDDAASIAAAITELAGDAGAREAMGARARTLAEQRYNWQIESQKLTALYERLAGEAQ